LQGAYCVLRANQVWAPYPDNDPDAARDLMRRFYALVVKDSDLSLDPVKAAELEVEWWRLHREHQYGVIGEDEPLVPIARVSSGWAKPAWSSRALETSFSTAANRRSEVRPCGSPPGVRRRRRCRWPPQSPP